MKKDLIITGAIIVFIGWSIAHIETAYFKKIHGYHFFPINGFEFFWDLICLVILIVGIVIFFRGVYPEKEGK